MPLFGSKHHDNDAIDNTTSKGDRHHTQSASHGPPGTAGTNTARTYPPGAQTGAPLGYGANPGPTNTFAPDQYSQQPSGHTGQPIARDAAYPGGGGVAGPGGASGIPQTSAVNYGGGGGGSGQRLTGKVESALGSLVGSAALKEKGAQKEQEANTIKLQGRELAEAERLEAEALMRRERAVAHGAHPANATLGGLNVGSGQGHN
ncbi:hypothetical protein HYPSUDRAFT_57622 [Hypholoma sublateritium FD-334 SS-4]|uniref:CsbD-like domain-containing protein n=1 Tax=Hypholoma sublateritium (strain FD-334 SS-4) TaxID=945553 RepID=A0A0D2PB77_HYPSF|nr:hypothetical protein HYPSUDRAFT_57622 [Hypholoma sublateritium FD-334 SS-4]